MGMVDIIKQASIGAVGASNPVNIVFGEIIDLETEKVSKDINYSCFLYTPTKYTIRIDQKLILDERFFIMPESLIRYEIDLSHDHKYVDEKCSGGDSGVSSYDKLTEKSLNEILVIREGLKKGDKVLLLRVQGGQQYVILDKVV